MTGGGLAGVVVLAIETSTSDMNVAIADADGPLAEVAVRRQRRHAESLHPAIESVCRESGVVLRDLTAVAVDVGPGLFTGLRVGVTAAKVLAVSIGTSLVTSTSLSLLARFGSGVVGGAMEVLPVIDMRRGEVAWQFSGDATIARGTPERLAAELARRLHAKVGGVTPHFRPVSPPSFRPGSSSDGLLLVGDGAIRYADLLRTALPGVVFETSAYGAAPEARVLAQIAIERLLRDIGPAEVADPLSLVPLYLRDADVAIGWETRQTSETGTAAVTSTGRD